MNSYIQHIRNEMISTKQQVMLILGWTEMEYANFQLKKGRQYLQAYISKDPQRIDELLESKIYWNWFKNEWLFRDTAFVKVCRHESLHIALEQYYNTHNHEVLINTTYPSAVIMHNGYAKMIGKINAAL